MLPLSSNIETTVCKRKNKGEKEMSTIEAGRGKGRRVISDIGGRKPALVNRWVLDIYA